jgi:putative transcriptional regulator
MRHRAVQMLASAIATLCILHAQSTNIKDLAAGKVLLMERNAPDPIFAESVILLIHYDMDGVVGLMLHRTAGLPLSRLHELEGAGSRSDPIYVGGPVELDEVTGLFRAPNPPPDGMAVGGGLYAVQTKRGLGTALKASKGPDDLRIYLGYCGWSVPQLQNEVMHGSWYIFDHGERFAFDATPGTLWKRLIERTEARVAQLDFGIR